MRKKGDLSMSTIVMAVIAVLILVVLSAIVLRNLGGASETLSRCPGVCEPSCGDLELENPGVFYTSVPNTVCQSTSEQCCVRS